MNRDGLYSLRRKLSGLDQLKQTITNLETMRISPRAAAYGGSRVQSSPKGDIQPDNIQRIDSLLAYYNAELAAILDQVRDFEEAATALEGKPKEIMRAYFLEGKTWEQICVEQKLGYRRVMYIRNEALDTLFGALEAEGQKKKC